MINGKSVFAIIPARSGSKGLPGKNIRPICGKPLIEWSILKANKSRYIDVTVVSTDTEEIAAAVREIGGTAPFLRPPELATDKASTYDVIRHALGFYEKTVSRVFDYTVLLEPTSPLREDDDIDQMLALLDARCDKYDSIISIGEVTEHPSIMKKVERGELTPFVESASRPGRRQDNPPVYFPYGVAYIAKTRALLQQNTFYTNRCTYYLIKRYQNYEIDDIYDFMCVEAVMRYQWGVK